MAQFSDFLPTRLGLDMIAQSQAGSQLIFTKVSVGDGQLGDTAVTDLTALVSPKLDAQIRSVTALSEGHVQVEFAVDNSELDAGFFVREVGLFAKIGEEGEEKLYGYANAGNTAGYLSDKTVPLDALRVRIDVIIGAAQSVSFTADKTLIYATQDDMEKHNTDATAHANLLRVTGMAETDNGIQYTTQDGKKTDLNLWQKMKTELTGAFVPTADRNPLASQLDGIAHQIKAITGKTNWYDAPSKNLEGIVTALGNVAPISQYNVSNANAWWVKFAGNPGLIIQGGLQQDPQYGGDAQITRTFPISFARILGISAEVFGLNSYNNAGGGADNITSVTNDNFSYHHGADVGNASVTYVAFGLTT